MPYTPPKKANSIAAQSRDKQRQGRAGSTDNKTDTTRNGGIKSGAPKTGAAKFRDRIGSRTSSTKPFGGGSLRDKIAAKKGKKPFNKQKEKFGGDVTNEPGPVKTAHGASRAETQNNFQQRRNAARANKGV